MKYLEFQHNKQQQLKCRTAEQEIQCVAMRTNVEFEFEFEFNQTMTNSSNAAVRCISGEYIAALVMCVTEQVRSLYLPLFSFSLCSYLSFSFFLSVSKQTCARSLSLFRQFIIHFRQRSKEKKINRWKLLNWQ